jgi:methylenetetrahydrofolate reductase (NADPH)
MAELEKSWRDFMPEFGGMILSKKRYFLKEGVADQCNLKDESEVGIGFIDSMHYRLMRRVHNTGFKSDAPLGSLFRRLGRALDKGGAGRRLLYLAEDIPKSLFLGCRKCGDCAIQHVGFLCPESGCPKHIRNGACGGSRDGFCEVNTDRLCVWYRAWRRFASSGEAGHMAEGLVPPRMWALDGTSSWLNFHLGRDHQGTGNCLKEVGSCKL